MRWSPCSTGRAPRDSRWSRGSPTCAPSSANRAPRSVSRRWPRRCSVSADAAKERKRARKLWWSVTLGRPLLELLGATWRFEERNADVWQRLRAEKKPYILAVWHGQFLGAMWVNRFRDITALASFHGDAEIIARLMKRWGFGFVRGSSSAGGREALVEIVEF